MLARGSRSMVLLQLCGQMEGRAPRSGSPPLVGATVRARWTAQPCPRGHDTERTWNGAGERGAASHRESRDLRSAAVDLRLVLAAYALEAPLTLFGLPQQGANNTMYGVGSAAGSFVLKRFDAADGTRLAYAHRL